MEALSLLKTTQCVPLNQVHIVSTKLVKSSFFPFPEFQSLIYIIETMLSP